MSLDIKMFLEFTGILITIGVVLLIISIIIIIIAYRQDKKENKPIAAENLSMNDINYNNVVSSLDDSDYNDDQDMDKTKIFPKAINSANQNNVTIPKVEIKKVLEDNNSYDHDDLNEKTIDAFEEEFNNTEEKNKYESKSDVSKKSLNSSDDEVELL